MADYQLTQTGNEVQDILDSVLRVTGVATTLTQSGSQVQSILNGSRITTYTSVTQLGFTSGSATIVGVYNAMVSSSVFIADAASFDAATVPDIYGVIVIVKVYPSRGAVFYLAKSGTDFRMGINSSNEPNGNWTAVSKRLTVRSTSVSVNKASGSSVSITAPSVSGYTFSHWINTATSGWIGATYIESVSASSTKVWVSASSASSGTGNVNAWALYVEN